jgi:antitoxin component of MazEF toxin-antitoxin module
MLKSSVLKHIKKIMNIRKVQLTGNQLYVNLPMNIVKAMKIEKGDHLRFDFFDNTITITKIGY